jgi:hypothetical protein
MPATRYLLLALVCATLDVSVAAAQNVTRVAPGYAGISSF